MPSTARDVAIIASWPCGGDADETRSGVAVGLHHHDGNPGQPFDESCTGLDHMSFGVAGRADLDAWARWLDSIGVELELISMAG
jgi:hypothetical protein